MLKRLSWKDPELHLRSVLILYLLTKLNEGNPVGEIKLYAHSGLTLEELRNTVEVMEKEGYVRREASEDGLWHYATKRGREYLMTWKSRGLDVKKLLPKPKKFISMCDAENV